MPLVLANGWLEQVQVFREAWLKGRKGGGKTLLAFATAQEFIKRGISKGCISNIGHSLARHPWDELIINDRGELEYRLIRDAFIVYDEPWVNLDNRSSLSNDRTYGAGGRKFGVYMMLPSFIPIDKRLSYLQCQRVSTFTIPIISMIVGLLVTIRRFIGEKLNTLSDMLLWVSPIGKVLVKLLYLLTKPIEWLSEPIWVYRWSVEQGDITDSGTFFLVHPSEYFNLFDTADFPLDDGDIGELWKRTILESKKNDFAPGRWWVQEGENDNADNARRTNTGQSTEPISITVKRQYAPPTENDEGEYSEGEGATGNDAGSNRYDYAKVRQIENGIFGRETPHYADEEY